MKARPKPNEQQAAFLYPDLINQLDPKDPLLLLAKKIPWEKFENAHRFMPKGEDRPNLSG